MFWRSTSSRSSPESRKTGLERTDFSIFRPGYAEQIRNGFRPRNGVRAVRLSLPLDWDMDPLGDRNWRFHLHAWRMLDPIWEEFYEVDWARLREEVMPWVRDWHRYHLLEGSESEFSWYDMSTGFRAQHLALLVHLHVDGSMPLSTADLTIVEQLCGMHHERLRDRHFIARNNHGIFQLQGLRLLGAACAGRVDFKGEPAYSAKMLMELVRSQFDSFGVHVENSPDYHGLILKQISRIRPELFPSISRQLREVVSKAREVQPWFTWPDGRIVPLGDSEGLGRKLGPSALADTRFDDGEGRAWLVRDLSASGYVVVRTSPETDTDHASMMVVRGHSVSQTHAHADNLSFVLFERGREFLVDSGKYHYGRDRWREYFTADRAHNVVGLKGVKMGPQHLTDGGQGIDALDVDAATGTVTIGGFTSRRDYFRHRRLIRYQPSVRVEVSDIIDARPEDAPVVYWHLAPDLDAERAKGGVDIYRNGTRLARISVGDAETKPRLAYGQEKPYIQGWVSPAYRVRKPATVIEFVAPRGRREIHTLIELFPEVQRDASHLPRRLTHGVRFTFSHRFRRDRVFLLPSGHTQRRVVVELLEPDLAKVARRLRVALAAAGFSSGRVTEKEGVLRATYLHEDGTKVITRLRPPTEVGADTKHSPATLYFAWSREARAPSEVGDQVAVR